MYERYDTPARVPGIGSIRTPAVKPTLQSSAFSFTSPSEPNGDVPGTPRPARIEPKSIARVSFASMYWICTPAPSDSQEIGFTATTGLMLVVSSVDSIAWYRPTQSLLYSFARPNGALTLRPRCRRSFGAAVT